LYMPKKLPKKAELKTKKTTQSVSAFLNSIEDIQQKKDAKVLAKLFTDITCWKPKMWGTSIVGYGDWHYVSPATGRNGDFMATGFSPRKSTLTIYIMLGYSEYGALLEKLGPHKLGKSCLYIKCLDDVHLPTLKKLIKTGVKDLKKKYKDQVR